MDLLTHLKELRLKATQDTWEVCEADPDEGFYINTVGSTKTVIHPYSDSWQCFCGPINNRDDAEYIVALHNALPQLIAQLEAGERTFKELNNMLNSQLAKFPESALDEARKIFAQYEQSTKEV